MDPIGRIDEFGKPAWIGLMVLSFIVWWPLGLAMLFFLLGSGRMGRMGWCGRHGAGRWYRNDESRESGEEHGRWWPGRRASSGNRAFDEYRNETLKRLEDEQREFKDFLERLRHAKDKAEFDQFMADRGRPAPAPEPRPEA
jgi:Protein of unknown function (DUF2852)